MAAQTDTIDVRSINRCNQSASEADAVDHRGRLLVEILETNGRRLESFARSVTGSSEDGEDAMQQGCLQFCRCYEGSGDPVGWLFLTVKREALSIWRKKGRRRESSINGFASQPDVEVDLTAILESDGASVLQGRVLDVVMSSPRVMTAGATEVAGDEIAARAVQSCREVCSGVAEVARAVQSPGAPDELRGLAFAGPRDLSPAALMALGLRVELRQDAGVGARQVLEDLDLAVEDHRLAIGEENAAPFDRQLWQAAREIREVSYQVHVPLMDEPRLEGEILASEHHTLAGLICRAQGIALEPPAPGEIEELRADLDRLTIELVSEPATAIEKLGTRFQVPAPTGLPREVWGHEVTQGLGADTTPGAGMARHVTDGLFVPGAHWDTEHVIVARAPEDWVERWPSAGIKSGDVVVGRYTAGSCEEIIVHRAARRLLSDAEPLEWSDPEPEALLRGFGVDAPVATRTQAQRFGLERIAPAVAKAISTDRALTPFEMRYGIQPAEPGIEITGP